MAEGKILYSDLFDEKILDKIKELAKEMKGLAGSVDTLRNSYQKVKIATEETNEIDREKDKLLKQIAQTNEKLSNAESDLNKQLLQAKIKLQQKNREMRNEMQAEASAYSKLSNEARKATAKYKDLAAQYGELSEEAKKAKEEAHALNTQLIAIDEGANQHQRKVGRYTDALAGLDTQMMQAASSTSALSSLLGKNLGGSLTLVTNLFRGLGVAVKSFATNPMGLLMTALGSAVALFISFKDKILGVKEAVEDVNNMSADAGEQSIDQLKRQIAHLETQKKSMDTMLDKMIVQAKKGKDITALYELLKQTYGEYIDEMKVEDLNLESLIKLRERANLLIQNSIYIKSRELEINAEQERQAELAATKALRLEQLKEAEEDARFKISAKFSKDKIDEAVKKIDKLKDEINRIEWSSTDLQIRKINDQYNDLIQNVQKITLNQNEQKEEVRQTVKYLDKFENLSNHLIVIWEKLQNGIELSSEEIDHFNKMLENSKEALTKMLDNKWDKIYDNLERTDDKILEIGKNLERTNNGVELFANLFTLIAQRAEEIKDNISGVFDFKASNSESDTFILKLTKLKKLRETDENGLNPLGDKAISNKEYFEELLKLLTEFGKEYIDASQKIFNEAGNFASVMFDKELQEIDIKQKKQDEYYEAMFDNYKNDKEAYAQLTVSKELADKQLQQERLKISQRQAKLDKAMALFNIGINIPQKIVENLGKPAMIALISALGAMQIATVLAKPIPQYFKGLEKAKQDHIGQVAEKGRELMQDSKGNLMLFEKEQFAHIPKGAKIFTNKETEFLLNKMTFRAMLPNYIETNYNGILKDINRNIKRKNNFKVVNQGINIKDLNYYKRYDI